MKKIYVFTALIFVQILALAALLILPDVPSAALVTWRADAESGFGVADCRLGREQAERIENERLAYLESKTQEYGEQYTSCSVLVQEKNLSILAMEVHKTTASKDPQAVAIYTEMWITANAEDTDVVITFKEVPRTVGYTADEESPR